MGRSVNSPGEYDIIVHFNWLSNAWTKACLPERNQVPEYCPSHRTMVAQCALKAFSPSQPTVAFHVICHFMLFASCLICTYVILFPYVMQHWIEIGLEAFSFLSNPQFSNRYMLKVSKIDARRTVMCSELTIIGSQALPDGLMNSVLFVRRAVRRHFLRMDT